MIRRETDYAFRLLVHLAARPGAVATAGELAAARDVPLGFARKILRRLARAGILDARPGRRGGFVLIEDPCRISVLRVVTILQGPLVLNRCMKSPKLCRRQPTCPIAPLLQKVQGGLNEVLESSKLADILAPRRSAAGKRPGAGAGAEHRAGRK
jgi:Rrf2 family protein